MVVMPAASLPGTSRSGIDGLRSWNARTYSSEVDAGIEPDRAKDQDGADGAEKRCCRLDREFLVEQPFVDHLDRQGVEEGHDHGDDDAGSGRCREKTHVLSSHERSDSRSHACLPTATRGARDRPGEFLAGCRLDTADGPTPEGGGSGRTEASTRRTFVSSSGERTRQGEPWSHRSFEVGSIIAQ